MNNFDYFCHPKNFKTILLVLVIILTRNTSSAETSAPDADDPRATFENTITNSTDNSVILEAAVNLMISTRTSFTQGSTAMLADTSSENTIGPQKKIILLVALLLLTVFACIGMYTCLRKVCKYFLKFCEACCKRTDVEDEDGPIVCWDTIVHIDDEDDIFVEDVVYLENQPT